MTTDQIASLDAQFVFSTYRRLPVAFVRGEGCRLWDAEGNSYLDFLAGIAVCGLGHCHPKVVAAIQQQAATLMHTSNLYLISPQAQLAEKLCGISFADKAFFCNSGAEANEAAIKLARKYAHVKRGIEVPEIITFEGSFHGRTMATVTATGQPKYHRPFPPLPSGFVHIPLNDVRELKRAVNPSTAAIMIEPIQGESGVRPATRELLETIREICTGDGPLMILDEVQTGLGRTGKMFAYEHYGLEPDVMTLAKSLAGGLPMGAMLAREDVSVFEPGDHASTFGGNHLACVAALAVLTVLEEEGIVANAQAMGERIREKLHQMAKRLPVIEEIRGQGLMVGIELSAPIARAVNDHLLKNRVLMNAIGDHIVRMLPPLTVTAADVDEALAALESALESVSV